MKYGELGDTPNTIILNFNEVGTAGKNRDGKRPSLMAWLLLRYMECTAFWEAQEAKKAQRLLLKKHPGWFPMPMAQVEEALGLAEYTQMRLMKELRTKGWIKTKTVGIPGKRWVKFLNPEKKAKK
jgi:hypothetical protein